MSQQLLNLLGSAPGGDKLYVEDVFSTYLYTGNDSTQTITNGIDLAGEGGMVWIKNRSATADHLLIDSVRGSNKLSSNTTAAESSGYSLTLNSDGFSFNDNDSSWNANTNLYTSWTFRKAPKFFDVVTYTGNSSSQRNISHNLGSVPGCIMIKNLSAARSWIVYHRGITATPQNSALVLNSTTADTGSGDYWGATPTQPTSTVFTVGSDYNVNGSGDSYVAYLFAHNDSDGEFGENSDQDIIKCGGYSGNGGVQEINLGFEPQWVLIKKATGSTAEAWVLQDVMRGMHAAGVTHDDRSLLANSTTAEYSFNNIVGPTATGFVLERGEGAVNASGSTYIYIAIRRGPMKTPESATDVFNVTAYSGNSTDRLISSGFPTDVAYVQPRNQPDGYGIVPTFVTRLARSPDYQLDSSSNTAESSRSGYATNGFHSNQGMLLEGGYQTNQNGYNYVMAQFRRAPGFFDVVCYSSDGNSSQVINHNLGVTPELIITKRRDGAYDWIVSDPTDDTKVLFLNLTDASTSYTGLDTFTSTTFTAHGVVNSDEQVAYLFASLPGVSKVGSYTGNGSSQTINCGFSNGARFVLIKRTDSTGSWFVFDTARGINEGTDPYLRLNLANAETTGGENIDPAASGFIAINPNTNTSDATYIYLAIA